MGMRPPIGVYNMKMRLPIRVYNMGMRLSVGIYNTDIVLPLVFVPPPPCRPGDLVGSLVPSQEQLPLLHELPVLAL